MRKYSFFLVLILVFVFMQVPAMAREETTLPISGKNLGGYPYADFFDEDNMVSDSAYGVPSQQSVKAYADRGTGAYVRIDTETEAQAQDQTYNVWLVDTVNYAGHTDSVIAGVSVYLPAGSAALDKKRIRIVNVSESGTTDVLVVPANDVWLSSGVTDHIAGPDVGTMSGVTYATGVLKSERMINVYDIADAEGEAVEYVYEWVSAMSGGTWWQIDLR